MKNSFFAFLRSSLSTSRVISRPLFNCFILSLLISNPQTSLNFPNSTARGRPTYPRPITAIFAESYINFL